jgi:hypothetical protein
VTREDAVRAYFAAYSQGRPEQFDEIVSPDYVDYGHTPPGHGPQAARDDYEHAVKVTDGVPVYDIDALVARDDTVAAAWTGHLPNGSLLLPIRRAKGGSHIPRLQFRAVLLNRRANAAGGSL